MSNPKLIRWPRLAIGVVTLLFAGLIYAWSILKAPFEGYWDAAQLGVNYSLTVCFFCLGGLFSGLISKKTSSGVRLVISAALLFSGFFITSRLGGGSVIPLYLAYGVLAGLGIGFAYNTVIGTTNAWFPDKQGFSSGTLLAGFGLSSLIMGRVADILGRSDAIGWKNTYVIFAISIGALLLVSALLVKPPPKDTVFPAPRKAKKSADSGQVRDFTAQEVLRRPSFYMIFVYATILASPGLAAIGFATDIVTDVGGSIGFAVTAVGILAVFNGLGRLVTGWLFDGLGVRKAQLIISSIGILAPLTVTLALLAGSLPLGVVGICLCSFTYGATPTSLSVLMARFYGQKNFPLIFSMANLVLLPAPLAATLAGVIKTGTGAFTMVFVILTVCTAAGFVVNIWIRKP